ncbi:hypothetical protein [Caballeronia sp. dw_19]|uniref:phage tail fiber protein n=1 Tax=Caballeronia sp. dw_19 TaxID=2719791 RepID=UPI001BD340DE|nr:hypothetical protein [Caballeronia sp. dw_19]
MTGTLIHVTKAGRAALVALGNAGTAAHKVTTIGVSTGAFDDTDETLTILPGERKRISTISGENVAADTIHVTLKDDTADQYSLYGFGLYLENGILFAVYSQTTPIMEKSPAAMLLLAADMQFTTIDAAQLYFGDATFTNPPATTERQGVVELATDDESQDGEDAVRAVTPSGVRQFGFQFGTSFMSNTNTDLTKKHVGKAIQWYGADGGLLRLPPSVSLKAGSAFYIYNQGAGRLTVGLVGTGDFIWTMASRASIELTRGEYAIFLARTGGEYDLVGGTASLRYIPRLVLNGAADDDTTSLQVNGAASVLYGITIKGDRTGSLSTGNFDGLTIEAMNSQNTAKKPVALAPYGGRVLVGTTYDDGSNAQQVNGNARTYGTQVAGDSGTVRAWMTADTNNGYFRTAGNASVGSESATGFLDLLAGNSPKLRILPSGRVLIGTVNDDGSSLLYVAGNGRFSGSVQSSAVDAGGQFRAVAGNYGMFIRNDGSNVYLMQTASGDQYGTFNSYRPFAWNLSTGAVTIDQNGAGTTFGGPITVSNLANGNAGLMLTGPQGFAAGVILNNSTASTGRKYSVYSNNLGSLIFGDETSGSQRGQITSAGRWLINTADDGSSRFQLGGDFAINRFGGEGHIMLGQNDGYFYANQNSAGWYSPTIGSFQYFGTTKEFKIDGKVAWHTGNLNPIDKGGGTMAGQFALAEGTQLRPSLTFDNDGTPDTGLWHIADGVFGITNNGIETVRFGATTTFQKPVQSNANATDNYGVFRALADIGGTFANWNITAGRGPALQIDAPNATAAYMGMRWTRWGGRHFAAIDAYEGGTTTSDPSIVMHLGGQSNAWSFRGADITRGAGGTVWGSWNFNPASYLPLSGGLVTGNVRIYGGQGNQYSGQLMLNANGYEPYIRSNSAARTIEFINAANSAVNASVGEDGVVSFPRARPNWAGVIPWDTGNFDPNSKLNTITPTITGRLQLINNGAAGELGLRSNDGSFQFMRGRTGGGGMEWINSAYTAVIANTDDAGSFWMANLYARNVVQASGEVWAGNGGGRLAADGNIYGGVWGGYLSNWLNGTVNSLQNNINQQAPRRNGGANYGYVASDTGNSISINWGTNLDAYVDNQYQGALVTTNNFGNWIAPRSVMEYGGVGSYTYMNTGGNPGVNTLVNLPGMGGTWRVMSGAFGANGKDILYVRIA